MKKKIEEKNCMNCHNFTLITDSPCFNKGGCYYDRGYPDWTPKTNGDYIRSMSDIEIASLLIAYQGKNVKLYDILEWIQKPRG